MKFSQLYLIAFFMSSLVSYAFQNMSSIANGMGNQCNAEKKFTEALFESQLLLRKNNKLHIVCFSLTAARYIVVVNTGVLLSVPLCHLPLVYGF